MSHPELWQMRFSMYPEKARWVLDYKGVPHSRRSLLPGPHVPQLFLRFGQKAMPVLRHQGQVMKSSAAVVDYLERQWPSPALYPSDPAPRERALEIQAWFDDEIGPAVRRAAFYEWLPHTTYAARCFADGAPEWQQKLYVLSFPLIRSVMKLDMGIDADGAEHGRKLTEKALDFVAQHSSQTGYLVGDHFSIADVTAATVLQLCCLVPEYPVEVPEPRPEGWQRWLERWDEHPGCEYVRRMYRDHRGKSAEITD